MVWDWLTGKKSKKAAASTAGLGGPEASLFRAPPEAVDESGWAEARRRVNACRESGGTSLDLAQLKLRRLPPEIADLRKLTSLDISSNQLDAAVTQELASLVNLTLLKASSNRMGDAGARALGALSHLTNLDLSSNGIGTVGIQALSNLSALQELRLSHNTFGEEGARALASLRELRILWLGFCEIGDAGVRHLAGLKELTKLYVGGNKLSVTGAQALSDLFKLTMLGLTSNKIDSVDALSKLSALTQVFLDNTGIADVAALKSLPRLSWINLSQNQIAASHADLWRQPSLRTVILAKGTLGDVPAELLSKDGTDNCLPRLRAYFEKTQATPEPDVELRDIKVMILGNGRVGKTQLRRRLRQEAYDEDVLSTHGVEIVEAQLPSSDPAAPPTPLKIWDFGGQEIYLGTHALFLKTRAVFPVLWTPEMERNEEQEVDGQLFRNYPLTEWIRYVQQLAGAKSPVLLVQSQCEDPANAVAPPLDETLAASLTPPPVHLAYAARTGAGEAALLQALASAVAWQAQDRGPVRIPAPWAKIKTDVEALAANPSYRRITKADFFALCAKDDRESSRDGAEVLLGLLHQFGTLFHDPALFDDLIILDQNWALRAIYAVFDRTPGGSYATLRNRMYGRFTKGDLGRLVWDRAGFTSSEQDAFIAMMQACAIAFPLRPAEDDEETLFIAPELLPERAKVAHELAALWDDGAEYLAEEHAFSFLAPSFLREAMRTWGAVAGQAGLYWRDGLSFYDQATGAHALLEVRRQDGASWAGTLRIATRGGAAETLHERVTVAAMDIAERFGGQLIHGAAEEDDLSLRRRAARWRDEGAVMEPAIAPGPAPLAQERCFISYAHADDSPQGRQRAAAFDAVRARLPAVWLDPFFDTEQLRHGESVSRFIKLGAESPKYVVILSEKYLTSEFCMDELRRIWRACGEDRSTFQRRVRAVCLPDARIESLMEREAVRDHWVQKRQAWRDLRIKREGEGDDLSEHEHNAYLNSKHLAETVTAILLDIQDTLHIRSIADVGSLTFGGG